MITRDCMIYILHTNYQQTCKKLMSFDVKTFFSTILAINPIYKTAAARYSRSISHRAENR